MMPKAKTAVPALGKALSAFFKVYTARLAADKTAAKLKSEETTLKSVVVELMREAGLDKAQGAAGTVSTRVVSVAKATDWPAFYKWIQKTGNFECLEKRVHQANLAEVLEHYPRAKPGGIVFESVLKVTPTPRRDA